MPNGNVPNPNAGRAGQLLELARGTFDISPAEEKLFRGAANGELADYTAGSKNADDSSNAQSWTAERVLAANKIAWLCTDPLASELVTHRGIMVKGARVDGQLDLQNARVRFPLTFQNCNFLDQILLPYAEVRGLYLDGTLAKGILADMLKVEGSVHLRHGFKCEGEVKLLDAVISGSLDCENAQVANKNGKALSADGLDVGGSVFLRNGFKAEGEVRLLGATIGNDLNCQGGQFINNNGKALNGFGLKVEGNVFLRPGILPDNSRPPFRAEGIVDFSHATIGRCFFWKKLTPDNAFTLDLRSAKVGTLQDDEESWPVAGNLFLHGFVYDEISSDAPTDAKSRIKWLRCQPSDEFPPQPYEQFLPQPYEQFLPQPYEQLAAVLRKAGHEEDAKKMLIEKNKDRARLRTKWYYPVRWLYWLFNLLCGYGYRPWRAFGASLLLIVLGTFFFYKGHEANLMTPPSEGAYVTKTESQDHKLSDDYPVFCALVYSLETFVPLVKLHVADYWLPNANAGTELTVHGFKLSRTGSLLRVYLWLHTIAGWTLTTLWLGGLIGLIKT